MADDTVGYFKGLAAKTEPIRSGFRKNQEEVAKTTAPSSHESGKSPANGGGKIFYDDDDYKYMNKQVAKIGENLSRRGFKKYAPKRFSKR